MASQPGILIVVGAHLSAEVGDRPTAYDLQARIVEALRATPREKATQPADKASPSAGAATPSRSGAEPSVIVCSDVWYLNDDACRGRPAISLGGPAVNALTTYLGDKIPSAIAIEGEFVVQYDVESRDPLAACWGRDAAGTRKAVDVFTARYLDVFLRAAAKHRGA